jgi:NADPH:quinone reductase-like Zn-dependent oxidoreductase
MTASAESVVIVPDHLSDEQAACLPCAGVTAFSALSELGQLQSGQTVLCLGTGTVSLAALGIAKAMGARVCVTSRHDEKLSKVKRLGADFTINTVTTPEWQYEVKRLTGGVDQVIEVTGGETLGRAVRAVKPGAIVNLIGALSGSKTELELLPILMRQVRIQGVYVGPRRAFSNLLDLVRRTALEPIVGPIYELSDFRRAFDDLSAQKHLGNVCVRLA